MTTKNKEIKNKKSDAEFSDLDAKSLAFELFKKTGDINYYNFYSALKTKKK